IVKEFTERPSVSINEAGNRIETLFGTKLCPNAVRNFLKKGCKYLKACGIPSKAGFAFNSYRSLVGLPDRFF
ncbi:MAG: hypothetical protein LBT46_02960, partial [Planctomycetaceae bacterium]|nr:hypothetical protein [Planctomycetaceae bacterium]